MPLFYLTLAYAMMLLWVCDEEKAGLDAEQVRWDLETAYS